jgi:hypothetical protein
MGADERDAESENHDAKEKLQAAQAEANETCDRHSRVASKDSRVLCDGCVMCRAQSNKR